MAKIRVCCKVLLKQGDNQGKYLYPPPEDMNECFINYGTILRWKLDPSVAIDEWLKARVIGFYKEYGELHVECVQYVGEDLTKETKT